MTRGLIADMAAFPSEEQPYRDTIKVPAVLQMPGDPFPTEFYARYPEAFRVPVRLVWRERASPPSEAPSRPVVTDLAAREEDAERAFTGVVPEAADDARATPPAPAVGSAYGRAEPVATFLRINDALNRVAGNPSPAPAPGTPQIGPDGKPLDPYTPVRFFDDQGKPVLNPDHKQMMRPAGFDPHFFVERGLKDGDLFERSWPNTAVLMG
jgi:hypothetical protein